ncbi:hypothetical protein C2845_PM09G21040 [Panicum miliaceum]|uniref:BTB/POZ and MATH domain-containing protein 2-like n=1 Tax=Panicum miliaceum TaxID=4540 RepID=A0A3L6S1G1_PANMI|nr:hypothetical protein C2845_PM09G21040 [Panicum miliaceum]
MGASSSNLTDAACAVHLFKINGYSATRAMGRTDSLPSKRLAVGGYEWEVHYTPNLVADGNYWVAFKLVLLGAPRRNDVKAALKCRLVDASISSQRRVAIAYARDANGLSAIECQMSHAFKRAEESSGWLQLRRRSALELSGCITEDSFTVECTITVITDELPVPDMAVAHVLPRHTGGSQSLGHDLGVLLRNGTGSDVTLVVSGESFTAHKAILASRSPVFMAQFFGHMKEARSQRVEIKDMKAAVFRAMLGFIYTDMVPELEQQEGGIITALHLLAAADMYGLDRLKSVCEDKLCDGANMETAATALALAEQHGCSKLKARCIELMAANIDAVMETEGYKHVMASSPLVMNDLLRALRGSKN